MTRPSRLDLRAPLRGNACLCGRRRRGPRFAGVAGGMAVGCDPVRRRRRPGQAACVCSAKSRPHHLRRARDITRFRGHARCREPASRPGRSRCSAGAGDECSTFCVALYLNRVHGWDSMSSLCSRPPRRAVAGLGARRRYLGRSALGRDRPVGARPRAGGGVAARDCRAWHGRRAVRALADAALARKPRRTRAACRSYRRLAALVAYRMRLPGGLIVGAMLASGILHGTGVVHFNLPPAIDHRLIRGARRDDRLAFYGTDLMRLRQLLTASFGALLVGMSVATVCSRPGQPLRSR